MKKKLVKDLAGLARKLDEIDKLLSTARVMINEMFWDIKTSIDKRKNSLPSGRDFLPGSCCL